MTTQSSTPDEADEQALVPYNTPSANVPLVLEGEAVALVGDPEQRVADGKKAADALMRVVESRKKKVQFGGETYLQFEDWQTVGAFHGCTIRVDWSRPVTFGDAHGFEARATVIDRHGRELSSAEAMCLNDEANWSRKPLFQLRSMAATRASSKAYRQVFAWVAVLAGYQPTPAEEMDGVGESKPATRRTSRTRQATPPPASGQVSQWFEVVVTAVKDPVGKGPYQVEIGMTDGTPKTFATFDETLAWSAARMRDNQIPVEIQVETKTNTKAGKTYTNYHLVGLRPLGSAPELDGLDDPTPMEDYDPPL